MQSHIEVELKWILPLQKLADVRSLLTQHLGPARILNQNNRYYDSADAVLKNNGSALRFRRENQQVFCTWKERLCASHEGVHQHRETNISVAMALWPFLSGTTESITRFVPLPEKLCALLGGKGLTCIGAFSNQRWEFSHQEDLLHLDQTTFPDGHVDAELEIESACPEKAEKHWKNVLATIGVIPVPQAVTKLHRMMLHR